MSNGNALFNFNGMNQSIVIKNDDDSRFVNIVIRNFVLGSSPPVFINEIQIKTPVSFLRKMLLAIETAPEPKKEEYIFHTDSMTDKDRMNLMLDDIRDTTFPEDEWDNEKNP
jgi:hypothetical protein